jgi:hypothetical protein
MGKIKSITNKFSASMVPYVLVKNECKTIEIGGTIRRTPNTLINDWDLLGYEVRGEPTEIIGPNKKSGMGFICDEAGVTVSLERSGPEYSEENSAENEDLTFTRLQAIRHKLTAEIVPFVLISNSGKTLTWGGYIRKRGKVLTDGPGKPAYRIVSDTTEIINQANGKTGIGYICDETGVTVDIKRDFHIEYPLVIKKRYPDLEKVLVKVRFSGVIGILGTFDRIPTIFDVGQSRKNFYMGLAAGLIAMFMIRLLF